MSLITVTMKFRTVTVTFQQLVHVNNCNFSAVVVTSDSVTSTEEEESNEPENSDDKTRDILCKTDKKSIEHFLGTTVLNTIIDNPESVVEVMSSFIGDNLIQLLTEQYNLYNRQNA